MKYFLKNQINIKNHKSGFMMVELIIAIAIIGISILAFSNVAQKSINISRQSLDTSMAAFLLEEGAEVVRLYRDINWSNITTMNVNTEYYINFDEVNSTWYFTTTPTNIDKFTRKVIFANVNRDAVSGDISLTGNNDPGTRLVTVYVSWQEGGAIVAKNLSFYISDIFS
jgi:Tfp pilus assembly protein PilV